MRLSIQKSVKGHNVLTLTTTEGIFYGSKAVAVAITTSGLNLRERIDMLFNALGLVSESYDPEYRDLALTDLKMQIKILQDRQKNIQASKNCPFAGLGKMLQKKVVKAA